MRPAMRGPEKILTQIEDWRSKLLDITKRNRLINCKIRPTSAIELLHPSPQSIWDYLAVREASLKFAWKEELVPAVEPASPEAPLFDESEDESPEASEDTSPRQRRIPIDQCLASRRLRPDFALTELTDAKLSTR